MMSFLVADYYQSTGVSLADLRQRAMASAGGVSSMDVILERALERGEIVDRIFLPLVTRKP